MSKKKGNKILILLVITGAASYFYFAHYKNSSSPSQQGMQTSAPLAVDVMIIQKQNAEETIELPARINGYKISQVRPQASGIIKKRNFIEGSFVKEGQQLYQIDPVIYEASYKKAKMNLTAVKAKRDRYKNLLEQEAISKQEFDDIEASLAQAESDYQTARENFNYTKVYAPISGYIGKTNFTEGALVSANQSEPLTTITELDPIYIDISQSSSDAIEIKKKKDIKVSLVINGKEYEEKGELKLIESFVDPSTDSITLRAQVSNKNQELLPGMFVTAKLHIELPQAILVPQKATSRNSDGSLTAWIIEGNIAKARKIKAQKTFKDNWIVEEGLNEGDVIVYEGLMKIREGANVITAIKQVEDVK